MTTNPGASVCVGLRWNHLWNRCARVELDPSWRISASTRAPTETCRTSTTFLRPSAGFPATSRCKGGSVESATRRSVTPSRPNSPERVQSPSSGGWWESAVETDRSPFYRRVAGIPPIHMVGARTTSTRCGRPCLSIRSWRGLRQSRSMTECGSRCSRTLPGRKGHRGSILLLCPSPSVFEVGLAA